MIGRRAFLVSGFGAFASGCMRRQAQPVADPPRPPPASAITVESIARLRATTSTEATRVARVLGHSSPGDGGGGTFVWADEPTPDNNGTVIVATTGRVGAWRRAFSGAFEARWFGARGDGITDDTAALNAVLAAAAGSIVRLGRGQHLVKGTLRVPTETALLGAGAELTQIVLAEAPESLEEGIICNAGSADPGRVDRRIVIAHLCIDGRRIRPERGRARGIFLNRCVDCTVVDCKIIDTDLEGIRVGNAEGEGPASQGNIVLRCIVERPGLKSDNIFIHSATNENTNSARRPSLVLDSSVQDCVCVGGAHGIALFNARGAVIRGNHCSDNLERGIIMGPTVSNVVVESNTVERAGSTGIHGAFDSEGISVVNNVCRGTRRDMSGRGFEGQGIKFYAGFSNIVIAGNEVRDNATDGIALEGGRPGSEFTIVHNHCAGNRRDGIRVLAGRIMLEPAGLRDGVVAQNTCEGNGADGIHIGTDDGRLAHPERVFVISNRGQRNAGVGLRVADAHGVCLAFNRMDGDADEATPGALHVGSERRLTFASRPPLSGAFRDGDVVINSHGEGNAPAGWVYKPAGRRGVWQAFGRLP